MLYMRAGAMHRRAGTPTRRGKGGREKRKTEAGGEREKLARHTSTRHYHGYIAPATRRTRNFDRHDVRRMRQQQDGRNSYDTLRKCVRRVGHHRGDATAALPVTSAEVLHSLRSRTSTSSALRSLDCSCDPARSSYCFIVYWIRP